MKKLRLTKSFFKVQIKITTLFWSKTRKDKKKKIFF